MFLFVWDMSSRRLGAGLLGEARVTAPKRLVTAGGRIAGYESRLLPRHKSALLFVHGLAYAESQNLLMTGE
ncbi:hypothetical protein [Ideonella oryzae]|uniref:Alpha/beta hydrolase n=1 Tax=Ideonella oryzae TaxID=2937441 RepID=A0ABT1BGE6_9BURK|nr:hypothetical protein [Ideonella oryzae]MCO5975317.1 hypothetical protein [Ideonella oryzae]